MRWETGELKLPGRIEINEEGGKKPRGFCETFHGLGYNAEEAVSLMKMLNKSAPSLVFALEKMLEGRAMKIADPPLIGMLLNTGYIKVEEGELKFNLNPERIQQIPDIMSFQRVNWKEILGKDNFSASDMLYHRASDFRRKGSAILIQCLMIYRFIERVGAGNYRWLLTRKKRDMMYKIWVGMRGGTDTAEKARGLAKKIDGLIKDARSGLYPSEREYVDNAKRWVRYLMLFYDMPLQDKTQPFSKNRMREYFRREGVDIIGVTSSFIKAGIIERTENNKYRIIPGGDSAYLDKVGANIGILEKGGRIPAKPRRHRGRLEPSTSD